MVRVKPSEAKRSFFALILFEIKHGESETHPLQTPPVIHISRLTSRTRPDRAMVAQTLRRVTGAYMQRYALLHLQGMNPFLVWTKWDSSAALFF